MGAEEPGLESNNEGDTTLGGLKSTGHLGVWGAALRAARTIRGEWSHMQRRGKSRKRGSLPENLYLLSRNQQPSGAILAEGRRDLKLKNPSDPSAWKQTCPPTSGSEKLRKGGRT